MSDDIIKFEPRWGPFRLNVGALLRRLQSSPEPGSAVAVRFLKLFAWHGVQPTQIQRFLPQVTLDKVASPATLLPALTNEVLDQAATLFGVRREWLEGDGDEIYAPRTCYKMPQWFFSDLAALKRRFGVLPLQALYCSKAPDKNRWNLHGIVIYLQEPIGTIGDTEIYRYHVYTEEWPWEHYPSRIQLKAMARLVYLRWKRVPLRRIMPDQLSQIAAGRMVPTGLRTYAPHRLLPRWLRRHFGPPAGPGRHTDTSHLLEDYALAYGSDVAHGKSLIARETDELPHVLAYIEAHGLAMLVPPTNSIDLDNPIAGGPSHGADQAQR